MKLLDRFTALGLLYRLVATLRQAARALERLAAAQEALVKMEALRAGVKPSRLQEAFAEAEKDEKVVLLTQTEEQLAHLYRLEKEAEARGTPIPEDADVSEFLYPEEKGDPFLER